MICLSAFVIFLLFTIALLFIVYGTVEENGGALLSGIIFIVTSFYFYYYTYNTLEQKEKWLIHYALDHNYTNKIFINKFKEEIIEIKKEKAINKIEKEYK